MTKEHKERRFKERTDKKKDVVVSMLLEGDTEMLLRWPRADGCSQRCFARLCQLYSDDHIVCTVSKKQKQWLRRRIDD